MAHAVGGIGDADHFATGEEGVDPLALRRHHLHAPGVARQGGNRHQVPLLEVLDGLHGLVDNQGRLVARRHVLILDVLEGPPPVVPQAQVARRPQHFRLAPGELLPGHGQQLLRRVGDQLRGQLAEQGLPADGVSDDGVAVLLLDAHQLFPQQSRVFFQAGVHLLVGLGRPPGKGGMVAVVKLEPLPERRPKPVHGPRGAVGDRLGGLQILRPGGASDPPRELLDLFVHFDERGGGFGRVQGIDALASFLQTDDGGGERRQCRHLLPPLTVQVQLPDFPLQLVPEKEEIYLRIQSQAGIVDPVERRPPGVIELPEDLVGRRRQGQVMEALQAAAVAGVQLQQAAQVLGLGAHQRRNIRRRVGGESRTLKLRRHQQHCQAKV